MQRSILIIAACCWLALGAAPQKKLATPPPLPPLNQKVVDFARKNLGKPVGNGICITLAKDALEAAGAKRSNFREPNGDYVWGELVPDFKDVLPGDILQFRDASFKGQKSLGGGRKATWFATYDHHTAVVAKVERGGRLITIYQQNVAVQGKDESEKGNVQEAELRMESLQKGGWIKAYRPVPLDPDNEIKDFDSKDNPRS
jgi:hypothetical protein